MRHLFLFIFSIISGLSFVQAQGGPSLQNSKWGPNDTLVVQAIIVDGEIYPYSELPVVIISKLPYKEMAKQYAAYNRLRNAVYVTYPYARQAGAVINDVNVHLLTVSEKGERKKIH